MSYEEQLQFNVFVVDRATNNRQMIDGSICQKYKVSLPSICASFACDLGAVVCLVIPRIISTL